MLVSQGRYYCGLGDATGPRLDIGTWLLLPSLLTLYGVKLFPLLLELDESVFLEDMLIEFGRIRRFGVLFLTTSWCN